MKENITACEFDDLLAQLDDKETTFCKIESIRNFRKVVKERLMQLFAEEKEELAPSNENQTN